MAFEKITQPSFPGRGSDRVSLARLLWPLRNKCNHEFGNPTDGSRWDSEFVAFISQASLKLG
jgi:hypothetical protein